MQSRLVAIVAFAYVVHVGGTPVGADDSRSTAAEWPPRPGSVPSLGSPGAPPDPRSVPSLGSPGAPPNPRSVPTLGSPGAPPHPRSVPSLGSRPPAAPGGIEPVPPPPVPSVPVTPR